MKNNDNQPGEQIAQLNIRVRPAPWAGWWAYIIYVIIISGLLLLFRSYILSWARINSELEFEKRENEQIKELNQMKLRFFTNISHEFKTPLTLLQGYIDRLSMNLKDNRNTSAMDQIRRNSNRLLHLVDELMEFRKAETGLLKFRASEGDIVKYAREIKEEFGELALQKNIEYSFSSDLDTQSLWFDPGKIEKVLFNLISNAFKFTPDGGSINVSLTRQSIPVGSPNRLRAIREKKGEEWLIMSVSDSGQGIAEKDLAHIFERFFQVSDADDDQVKGTGIGLALSKRLVEVHRGTLNVISEVGKGSVFSVHLPVGVAHLEENEKVDTDRERFYLRLDYSSILNLDPVTDDDSEYKQGKPVLLLIEDNVQIINLLKDVLSEHYNVIFAFDGESGISIVHEKHPDLIISDLMMPGLSGIDVCESLKCNPDSSHIPIILLTAKSGEESHLEGLNIGADAYLTKPFSSKLLIATIENILQSRQHLREKFASMDDIAPSDLTRNKIDELFLNRIIGYIEKNMADPSMDVAHLCKELGMSRSVLYRKIKSLTDHSIQEFIRGVRLRKAKQMLLNTDKSIAEVSYHVGFPNAKHFSTTFKKEFEVSPSDFRK